MVPNLSYLKQAAKKSLDDYPLLAATPRVDFNEKNPISESSPKMKLCNRNFRAVQYNISNSRNPDWL
jgi:hypothetical protein